MADMKEVDLKVVRFENVGDPRLGRHVVHDSRSRRFAAPRKALGTLKSVKHTVHIPVLDQGSLGACTGYAGAHTIGSSHFWRMSEPVLKADAASAYAIGLYSEATKLDPWEGTYEPEDTGSDGLSVAKALKNRGLISGYTHAFSLEATLTALAERVVMIGTSWHVGMYDPNSEGGISIKGAIEGGHEYVLDELDVERKRVWMRNSWGPFWGQEGRAWMTWNDLGELLADYGDVTVLVPREEPPPEPSAPPPAPKSEETLLAAALRKHIKTTGCPKYVRVPATEWLKTR